MVALLDQRMRGRSTEIDVPFGEYAQVFAFKDGRIVHWKAYLGQADALKAVGWSCPSSSSCGHDAVSSGPICRLTIWLSPNARD